jgi:hypothetical protein
MRGLWIVEIMLSPLSFPPGRMKGLLLDEDEEEEEEEEAILIPFFCRQAKTRQQTGRRIV